MNVLEYELPVKVEAQKGGGYLAVSPSWSDCYAQGETIDEVLWEIVGVAQSLIELHKEEGLTIPLKLQKRTSASSFSVPVIVPA